MSSDFAETVGRDYDFGSGAGLPIWKSLGAGADFRLLSRNSAYRDFPSVTRNVPEFRLDVKVFPRRAPYWAPEF